MRKYGSWGWVSNIRIYIYVYIGDEIVYIYICIGDEIYLYRGIYLFIYVFIYFICHELRIPIKQPGFHGKYIRCFFFSWFTWKKVC